jgi:hypothetical protein
MFSAALQNFPEAPTANAVKEVIGNWTRKAEDSMQTDLHEAQEL